MTTCCPLCGSAELRPDRAAGFSERVKALFGLFAVRCRRCGARIADDFRSLAYAHCPTCFRDELADWQEEYLPPRLRQRLAMLVGGKKQRCEVCRINFVSFRGRRREWTPYELRAEKRGKL